MAPKHPDLIRDTTRTTDDPHLYPTGHAVRVGDIVAPCIRGRPCRVNQIVINSEATYAAGHRAQSLRLLMRGGPENFCSELYYGSCTVPPHEAALMIGLVVQAFCATVSKWAPKPEVRAASDLEVCHTLARAYARPDDRFAPAVRIVTATLTGVRVQAQVVCYRTHDVGGSSYEIAATGLGDTATEAVASLRAALEMPVPRRGRPRTACDMRGTPLYVGDTVRQPYDGYPEHTIAAIHRQGDHEISVPHVRYTSGGFDYIHTLAASYVKVR